jgi:uncharacterized protein (DUF58 family)
MAERSRTQRVGPSQSKSSSSSSSSRKGSSSTSGDRKRSSSRRRSRAPHGRPPSLTERGRAWGISGALLLVGGAILPSWQIAALGVVTLAALCVAYIAFYPTSVMIWRRHLELQWGLKRLEDEGGFVSGRPFQLVVTLRNRGPRALGHATLRVFSSAALRPPSALRLFVAARSESTVEGEVWPRQAGSWHLHGAAAEIRDPFGLCSVEAYFPSPLGVNILPRLTRSLATVRGATGGAPHERLGPRALRHKGLGGDLRELRDHVPGDPFKQIAWKATARLGKLMVRDLELETMMTHYLLIDVGTTMRQGRLGATKLDRAVDLAASYARDALEAGDRVGLMTFDGRIVAEVKAGDGPVHRLKLVEPLIEATNAVDDDLTELTDSELVAVVARYLLFQEGFDTRVSVPPPIDDPKWSRLVSAGGELYDVRALNEAVQARLPPPIDKGWGNVHAATRELKMMRLFCRRRGIELPYRRIAEEGRRAAGLAIALERAAAGRGTQRLVVISDLLGLESGLDAVTRAVRLVRRRGHHLLCAAPSGVPMPEADTDEDEVRLMEISGWEEERRERAAHQRMRSLGVRVVPLRSDESAGAHLTRTATEKRMRAA